MDKFRMLKYLIVGISTTFVYFTIRFSANLLFNSAMLAVVIAQVLAIIYAFITNKLFVFNDKSKSIKEVFSQFVKFVLGRLATTFIDILVTYFTIEMYSSFFINLLGLDHINYSLKLFNLPYLNMYIGSEERLNEFIFACLVQVFGIFANYWISKLLVFNKTRKYN